MKPTLVLVVTLLICGCHGASHSNREAPAAAAGAGAGGGGGGGGDGRSAVTRLLEEYRVALLKNDYAALDRIWADDLTFVNPRGQLLSKAQRLANLRSGATAFKAIDIDQQVVRPYGDAAAVATVRVKLQAQYSGDESSGAYRVTTAWARPAGDWQMVAVHMTRIAE